MGWVPCCACFTGESTQQYLSPRNLKMDRQAHKQGGHVMREGAGTGSKEEGREGRRRWQRHFSCQ